MIVVGALIACGPYFYVQNFKEQAILSHQKTLKATSVKIEHIQHELSKFSSYEAEMKSYEEQKVRIVSRIETVNQLLKTRSAPVNLLDAIGQALPQRTWISALDFTSGTTPHIGISGKAFANEDISDFLDRITESIYLKDVNLENMIPIKADNNGEYKSFEISAIPRETASAVGTKTTPPKTPPQAVNPAATDSKEGK
mgnify:FL=1